MDRQPLVEQIPALRRYARALTGDAWAADDLVQDTLERACSRWRLWLAGSDLRAWLFTLMHHQYISQWRYRERRAPLEAAQDVDALADTLATPGGSEAATARDDCIDLQRCLLLLPEDQRAVLLLVTLEDMAYADVARVLKIPVGTVMSRLSRARARLQALMQAPANTPTGPFTATPPSPVTQLRRLK